MQRALIILLLLFAVSPACAKSGNKNPETFTVYINYPDYSVRANVLHGPAKVHPRTGLVYHWYSDNDIKETDGGFDGRLLHGEYKSFYLDKNLREQGMFRHGLKEDVWKTWFPGGRLHELAHYKKGKLHGSYERYDENGKLLERSAYKHGVKHGKSISYRDDKADTTVVYRNGRTKKLKQKTSSAKVKNDTTAVTGAQDKAVKTPKSRFSMKKVVNNEKKQEGDGLPQDKKKDGEDRSKKKNVKQKEKSGTDTPKKKRGSRVKKNQPQEDKSGANPS